MITNWILSILEVAKIFPPCELIMDFMIAKPKPLSSELRFLDGSTLDFPQYRRHFPMSDLLFFKLNGA